MQVLKNIQLVDDRYIVTVDVEELSAAEQEGVEKFGEPLVETGGEFVGTIVPPQENEAITVSFTLPTEPRRMPSQFPVQQTFDRRDLSDAGVVAKVWADEIESRLYDSREQVLLEKQRFVGKNISTIEGPALYNPLVVDAGLDINSALVGDAYAMDPTVTGAKGEYTYQWTILSGSPNTSLSQFDDPTKKDAIFTPSVAGEYTLRLTVDDPVHAMESDELTVSTFAKFQVNAGTNKCMINTDTLIISDASVTGGDNPSVLWEIEVDPSDGDASFDNPNIIKPVFDPDGNNGLYTLKLTASDNTQPDVSDVAQIEVVDPVSVNAGPDRDSLFKADIVSIIFSGTNDLVDITFSGVPDLNTLDILPGASLFIETAHNIVNNGNWGIDSIQGDYVLRVNIPGRTSNTDNEGTDPLPPIGGDSTATGTIGLTMSTSVNGGKGFYTYTWTIEQVGGVLPTGDDDISQISNPASPNPLFIPNGTGDYTLRLTVDDPADTNYDEIVITVQ
jgi:hypothetical protein